MTPMKLQKLLYFAQGWYLAIQDKPLFSETVEAWKYGPVVPTIYRELRKYGSKPIEGRAKDIREDFLDLDISSEPLLYAPNVPSDDKDTRKFLEKIYDVYGKFTGSKLSAMSHVKGGPWHKTVAEYEPDIPLGLDISFTDLKAHFKNLAERQRSVLSQ